VLELPLPGELVEMSPNGHAQNQEAQLSQWKRGRFVYVVLFLLAASYYSLWASTKYIHHLATVRDAFLRKAVDYLGPISLFAFFLETLIVLILCGCSDPAIRENLVSMPKNDKVKSAFYGAIGGVCLFAVSIPILFRANPKVAPVPFLLDHLYSNPIQSLTLATLTFFAIPITSEYVFRGILFRDLEESAGFWAAAVGSSALFGFLWPFYGVIAGFLLGMVTTFLYYRWNSLVPSIVSNMVYTITSVAFVAWRYLYR
jgi:membrane protease YdiL (CAAX protease family)